MKLVSEQMLEQLGKVNDPELHRDLVALNMVKNRSRCPTALSM